MLNPPVSAGFLTGDLILVKLVYGFLLVFVNTLTNNLCFYETKFIFGVTQYTHGWANRPRVFTTFC